MSQVVEAEMTGGVASVGTVAVTAVTPVHPVPSASPASVTVVTPPATETPTPTPSLGQQLLSAFDERIRAELHEQERRWHTEVESQTRAWMVSVLLPHLVQVRRAGRWGVQLYSPECPDFKHGMCRTCSAVAPANMPSTPVVPHTPLHDLYPTLAAATATAPPQTLGVLCVPQLSLFMPTLLTSVPRGWTVTAADAYHLYICVLPSVGNWIPCRRTEDGPATLCPVVSCSSTESAKSAPAPVPALCTLTVLWPWGAQGEVTFDCRTGCGSEHPAAAAASTNADAGATAHTGSGSSAVSTASAASAPSAPPAEPDSSSAIRIDMDASAITSLALLPSAASLKYDALAFLTAAYQQVATGTIGATSNTPGRPVRTVAIIRQALKTLLVNRAFVVTDKCYKIHSCTIIDVCIPDNLLSIAGDDVVLEVTFPGFKPSDNELISMTSNKWKAVLPESPMDMGAFVFHFTPAAKEAIVFGTGKQTSITHLSPSKDGILRFRTDCHKEGTYMMSPSLCNVNGMDRTLHKDFMLPCVAGLAGEATQRLFTHLKALFPRYHVFKPTAK